MSDSQSKDEVWKEWVQKTILSDIQSAATSDPVPMVDDSGSELSRTDAYDSYRLCRGSGDYLYMLYLLDEPADAPFDVIPVYIGETSNVANRLLDHFRKLRDALPISEWEDDGSWGSYGKYDHIATVCEHSDLQLYAWVVDVDDLETGPYEYPTYRQELEGKMVGLVHSLPQFNRVFANRDFVPNRVPHEMGKVGPNWVAGDTESSNEEAARLASLHGESVTAESKAELWHEWVEKTICRDINAPAEADPIQLFETDDNLVVETKTLGTSTVLKRSDAIDERIRREGVRCVHSDGVRDGESGLLYVMFQLNAENPSPRDVVPRYIGKGEAYGKKNELSANFEEIAKDHSGTRSFARWGDGSDWQGNFRRQCLARPQRSSVGRASSSNRARASSKSRRICGFGLGTQRPILGRTAIQRTSQKLSRSWSGLHTRRGLITCSTTTKFPVTHRRTAVSSSFARLRAVTDGRF